MKNITKEFPGVLAVDNVDFDLRPSEVHAIVGENGAGKSTLIKILSGYFKPNSGSILLNGEKVNFENTSDSADYGIRVIYQELNSFDELTVAENIFASEQSQLSDSSHIRWKNIYQEAEKVLETLEADLNPRTSMGELSVADKQIVEIGRAISHEAKILVMDEPTAALSDDSIEQLFQIINRLRDEGVAIIYISHRLDEVFEISDRVTVLRDGKHIDTEDTDKLEREEIVKKMVGRELKNMYPKQEVPINDVIFKVKNLSVKNILKNVSLELRAGEIVGIYGLLGSGKAALANALFGVLPHEKGTFSIEGREVDISHPIQARKNSMGLIPFDRKTEGLALEKSVKVNITMANIDGLGEKLFLDQELEIDRAEKWIDELNIQTPGISSLVRSLSGGNQQKVVVAKWLESNSKILILNEPTRGIDVGAKTEMYKLMEEQCRDGGAIMMISSELPEILSISDTILVMKDGKIEKKYKQEDATQEKIVNAAI